MTVKLVLVCGQCLGARLVVEGKRQRCADCWCELVLLVKQEHLVVALAQGAEQLES